MIIESKEVEKVEKISRKITELLNQGITCYSQNPAIRIPNWNLSNWRWSLKPRSTPQSERIAENSKGSLGDLISANMGIFQITGQNSGEDYSWGGTFNTADKNKTASITMKLIFEVYWVVGRLQRAVHQIAISELNKIIKSLLLLLWKHFYTFHLWFQ